MSKTLFDKVWDSHVVRKIEDGPDVFFIDRHFIHEVTSPVAFLGLKTRGVSVLYPERTFATADHNTPTINQHLPVQDALSANQLKALEENSKENGISHWGLGNQKNELLYQVLLLFVEIHILQLTVLLELSLLVLVLLKLKWYCQRNASCSQNRKKCESTLTENFNWELLQKTLLYISFQNYQPLVLLVIL